MRQFAMLTKALADENRLRAMMFLRHEELCLCQIIEMLQLAPSTVSEHMNVLARAGLIEARKEGRWHYYRWAGRNAPLHIRHTLNWLLECLGDTGAVKRDDKRLGMVLKKALQDLCIHYQT